MTKFTNLDDLCDWLNGDDNDGTIDMQSLPTFGGTEPEATDGVWSWDASRLLIETDAGYEIVER